MALQEILPDLENKGATLVSITPQISARIESNLRRYDLSFEILTDPGNNIAQSFGIVFEMPEYLRSFYREKGIDLLSWNGDDSWTLPIPANFVVSSDRRILYASGDPDYTTRPDPSELVQVLDSIAES